MKEKETKTQQITEAKDGQKPESKGKKVFKKIVDTLINILIVLVLITSILIATMALTSKASGVSTIFGYTIQPIQTDSMKGGSPDGYEGGDFGKGDLIIGKAVSIDDHAVFDKGDIVTYRVIDSEGKQQLLSHRIVETYVDENGNTLYRTWGDNREVAHVADQVEEGDYLNGSNIVAINYSKDYHGKVYKGVGSFLDFLRTQKGFFFVVLLPMIIFFLYALVRVVLSASNYKKSKADEDKDEAVKAAVAAALAEKEKKEAASEGASAEPAAAPAGMSEEELEQFRQFQAFQKMQKAQQEAQQNEEQTPEA